MAEEMPIPARFSLGSTAFVRMAAMVPCVAVALFVRTYFAYDHCFLGNYVSFQGTDSWYHVRAIEHLIRQFPHRLTFDPYALHPTGQHVAIAPLFDMMLASIALVAGWGSPSTELTHTICAWLPPIWGALMTIPVYFLGRMVGGHRAGLAAAAIIAILPGQFLQRTLLGSTDHHVAECMWSILTVLFLLRAIGSTNSFQTAFQPRVLVLRILPAGIFLGFYLLSWVGGSLFVLMLFLALVFHMVSVHLRGGRAADVCLLGATLFVVPLVMVIPYHHVPLFHYHIASLTGAAVFLSMSGAIAATLRSRALPRASFLVSVGILVMIGVTTLRVAFPVIFDEARASILRFVNTEMDGQIGEVLPLLYDQGQLTLTPLWDMFNVNAAVAFIGLAMLAYTAIRHGSLTATLLVVWTLFMAIATLYQRRFAYYLAINVAILSGYTWGLVYDYAVNRKWFVRCVGMVAFVALGLYPNMPQLLKLAGEHGGPPPDWHHALTWLRENTPEPFGKAAAYYAQYEMPTPDKPYAPPPGAYGIMCWWDSGYWVTQIARRVPTANPTQAGAVEAAEFLTAQNETAANLIMSRLGASYVMLDGSLPVWEKTDTKRLIGKFHNIIKWADEDPTDYFETYRLPNEDGTYKWKTFYYPKYYRSMLTRLYIFAGKEFVPKQSTYAVAFTTSVDSQSKAVKTVTQAMRFADFETARRFVGRQSDPNWRIVGNSHALSCVPLEPLRRYRLIYKSPTTVAQTPTEQISHVEIFEHLQEPDFGIHP